MSTTLIATAVAFALAIAAMAIGVMLSGKRLRVGHVFFRILERGEQNLRALERATLQVIPDRHRAFRERIRELLAETKRPLLDVLVAAATLRATARRHLDRMFEFWLHGNPASCYQYLSE